jgi:phosphotransferase system enzyme I (PtsI)
MNLRQGRDRPRDWLRHLDEPAVLVADELTPSIAAQIDWTKIRAFATDAGSRTYHTAILARSLDVPAVVGLHDASRSVDAGQLVVVDGDGGALILDPDEEVLARVSRQTDERRPAAAGEEGSRKPATTADGVPVRLGANIEFPDELATARYAGAEGIGLYRSEFLLTSGTCDIADEEGQYLVYREVVEGMAPGPVTIRTFDIDEDRLASRLARPPALGGWDRDRNRGGRPGRRGLRLSLARPDLFQVQLRALVRAARYGSLRIMFPFVSGVEQLREARRLVMEAATRVTPRGEPVPRVPIGVMLEVPAAAFTADLLARESDFFTIGTNDLIQYCLAVDRADERVSRLYEPLHPAILRLIARVRRAAARQKIPLSLCGEMAADPALLLLLVGLGLREFSMTPGAIPAARRVIAEARSDELRTMARQIVRLPTAVDAEQTLLAALGRLSHTRE